MAVQGTQQHTTDVDDPTVATGEVDVGVSVHPQSSHRTEETADPTVFPTPTEQSVVDTSSQSPPEDHSDPPGILVIEYRPQVKETVCSTAATVEDVLAPSSAKPQGSHEAEKTAVPTVSTETEPQRPGSEERSPIEVDESNPTAEPQTTNGEATTECKPLRQSTRIGAGRHSNPNHLPSMSNRQVHDEMLPASTRGATQVDPTGNGDVPFCHPSRHPHPDFAEFSQALAGMGKMLAGQLGEQLQEGWLASYNSFNFVLHILVLF